MVDFPSTSRIVKICLWSCLWLFLIVAVIWGLVYWRVSSTLAESHERQILDGVRYASAVYLCDEKTVDGMIVLLVREVWRHDTTLGPEPTVGDSLQPPDHAEAHARSGDLAIVLIFQRSHAPSSRALADSVIYSFFSGGLVEGVLDMADIREVARQERRPKRAEPGATDNPDDAQRLREDH